MKRKFRLTRSSDFKRVRKQGKSYAHPLVILIADQGLEDQVRIGVSAGRSVGNAVKRNRVKRQMRASLSSMINHVQPGWDLVFLARKPIIEARYEEIAAAEKQLLQRAKIFRDEP